MKAKKSQPDLNPALNQGTEYANALNAPFTITIDFVAQAVFFSELPNGLQAFGFAVLASWFNAPC